MRASSLRNTLFSLVAVGVAFAAIPSQASANATIVIVNNDSPGEGFNDPTPRAPIGGNPGTTVGQQRLNAFQHAANVWGATLDSAATIRILASFDPLTCTATSAVLGSAGAIYGWSNTPGAIPGVWYGEALANKLAGFDLNPPGTPGDPYNGADIIARFNSSIGTVPGCLTGSDWYYGIDNNHGANTDLVTVLLHEFGHGLGFSSFVSRPSGAYIFGAPGVYDLYLHDDKTNKDWTAMTDAERALSMKNGRQVAWTGPNVTAGVPSVLSLGTPLLRINAPAGLAGIYPVGTASFGAALGSPGVTGDIVVATDAATAGGPSTTDACTAITNAAAVAGKIAIVDRGACGFALKAKNVQNAGAIAMLVADNAAGSPPAGMSGVDPTVVIPSVRLSQSDGAAIKAAVGPNGTLALDLSVYAGADAAGRALVYTPDPVASGSNVSHWDTIAFRNQLMEPAINGDLTHSLQAPEDLTLAEMRDVGWYPDQDVDGVPDGSDQCANSVLGGTVVIASCDSGVPNTFFSNGCSIVDVVNQCGASAATHDDFTGCVTHFTNALKGGLISNKQKASIQRCAAKASIP